MKDIVKPIVQAVRPDSVTYQGVTLPRVRFGGVHFEKNESFLLSAKKEAARLQNIFGANTHSHVLEVGCGTGRLPIGIIETIGEIDQYEGLDVNLNAITWCQKHIQKKHPTFRFTHINMFNQRYNRDGLPMQREQLPFAESTFDIVYMYSVFSHMLSEDIEYYLKEFQRVLLPNGKIFLTAFVETGVADMTENPEEGYDQEWKGALHCVRYSRPFFESILAKYGFRIANLEHQTETDQQSAIVIERSA